MRHVVWLAVVTVLLLQSPLVLAQEVTGAVPAADAAVGGPEAPALQVDPELTDAATLRYQFVPGETDTYHLEMTQRMTMTGSGLGDGAETHMAMSMNTSQVFGENTEAGDANIAQTTSDTEVEVSVNGTPIPAADLAEMINGLSVRLVMSPRGEILSSALDEIANPQMAQTLSMIEDSFRQMTLIVPEGVVSVGDSWNQEVPLNMEQAGMELDTQTTATYTFEGWALLGEQPIAVIRSDMTVNLSGQFNEMGMTTAVEGSGTGTGYSYFDNGAGKLRSGDMEMTLNMRVSGEGMTVEQVMVMTMTVEKI